MPKIANVRTLRPVLAVPVLGHGGRTGDAVSIGTADTMASAKMLARRSGFDVLAKGSRFHGVADWSARYPDAWVVSVSGKAQRRKRNEAPGAERAFLEEYQEHVVDGDRRVPRNLRKSVVLSPELRQRLAIDAHSFVGNHAADIESATQSPGDVGPYREAGWAFYVRRTARDAPNPFADGFPPAAAARLAAGADEYGPLLVGYDRSKNALYRVTREGFTIESDSDGLAVVGLESGRSYWFGHDLEAATAELMRLEDDGRRAKRNSLASTRTDTFTRAYIEAALDETDDDGQPFSRRYDIRDISTPTMVQMRRDAASFQRNNRDDLAEGDDHMAGYLFWHNRNEAGVGFWDGRWPKEPGRRLSDAAHAFGKFDLYVGDDGKIHGFPLGRKASQTTRRAAAKPNARRARR